jgi:hypothetical protein
MSIVPMLGFLSEACLANQVGVARIGWADMRPRRLGPAETAEAENEKDRECREKEDIGGNGDGLKKLKHGEPPQESRLTDYRMLKLKQIHRSNLFQIAQIGKIYPAGSVTLLLG